MSRVQILLIAMTLVSSGLVEAQSPQGFGNGRFTEAYSVNLGANYSSMDVSELNQDGIPDMVMVSETLNSLIYLESSAEGVLQISATYDIGITIQMGLVCILIVTVHNTIACTTKHLIHNCLRPTQHLYTTVSIVKLRYNWLNVFKL